MVVFVYGMRRPRLHGRDIISHKGNRNRLCRADKSNFLTGSGSATVIFSNQKPPDVEVSTVSITRVF